MRAVSPLPLKTERIRRLEPPFGWIPFALVRSGFLGELASSSQQLYFFLCLVADRQGMSYYGDRRLGELLHLSPTTLRTARAELIQLDLIAYDGRLYQVLSLPPAARRVPRRMAPISRERHGSPHQLGAVWQRLLPDPES